MIFIGFKQPVILISGIAELDPLDMNCMSKGRMLENYRG
jgi:hypothetical protein